MKKKKKSKSNTQLELSNEYVEKILKLEKEHFQKYGHRSMTKKEMDELFGK